jgi:hypothetical protein
VPGIYDSATGRFISKDPAGTGYRYGRSNPVSLSDPSGLYELCGEDEVWGYICYDSTQVGLPADPPSSCDIGANSCEWEGGFTAPYEDPSKYGGSVDFGNASATAGCGDQDCSSSCGFMGLGCSNFAGPASLALDAVAIGFQGGAAVITDLATAAGCAAGPVGCAGGYAAGNRATAGLQYVGNFASAASATITCAAEPGSQDCAVSSATAAAGFKIPEPNVNTAIDIFQFCYDLGPCSW